MCVPAPKESAAPAPDYPSMQGATDLNPGGATPRGSAGLGRLQLRILGNPSAAPIVAPVAPVTPAIPGQQTAVATPWASTSQAPGLQIGSSSYSPNLAARINAALPNR